MISNLKIAFIPEKIHYSGKELRPHWILEKHKIAGSALIAFRGSCFVPTENLVDWEDRIQNDRIAAQEMLHFLGEFFLWQPREAVLLQRLLVSIAAEEIQNFGIQILRKGDDLFVDQRKLSVSIVTPSFSSQLLHFAINIDPDGAPVAALGIESLKISPEDLAHKILQRTQEEWNSIHFACCKVIARV